MFWIILLIAAALFIFRKEIIKNPRNFISLGEGMFSGWVVGKIMKADPGYAVLPLKGWIVAIVIVLAVVWGTEICRSFVDRLWPHDRGGGHDLW